MVRRQILFPITLIPQLFANTAFGTHKFMHIQYERRINHDKKLQHFISEPTMRRRTVPERQQRLRINREPHPRGDPAEPHPRQRGRHLPAAGADELVRAAGHGHDVSEPELELHAAVRRDREREGPDADVPDDVRVVPRCVQRERGLRRRVLRPVAVEWLQELLFEDVRSGGRGYVC